MITKSTFIVGLMGAFVLGLVIAGTSVRDSLQDRYLVNEGILYRFPAGVSNRVEIFDKKTAQWVIATPELLKQNLP